MEVYVNLRSTYLCQTSNSDEGTNSQCDSCQGKSTQLKRNIGANHVITSLLRLA